MCHGSSEMTFIYGCPVCNGRKCQSQVKIWSPLPAKFTSPYEWKILEWEDKQTKKNQTNKHYFIILLNIIQDTWLLINNILSFKFYSFDSFVQNVAKLQIQKIFCWLFSLFNLSLQGLTKLSWTFCFLTLSRFDFFQ